MSRRRRDQGGRVSRKRKGSKRTCLQTEKTQTGAFFPEREKIEAQWCPEKEKTEVDVFSEEQKLRRTCLEDVFPDGERIDKDACPEGEEIKESVSLERKKD